MIKRLLTAVFYAPPADCTHHASLYGVPCYFGQLDAEECTLIGTNVVTDWLLTHWTPVMAFLASFINDSDEWPIQLRGKIAR